MQFGVREICDVVLRAKNAMKIGNKVFYKNEPVLYFDSLKTSSMESQATTVYAQGGRGNARLIAWEGERTVTFTMEDALLSPEGFSILTGAGLIRAEEKPIIIHKTEITNKVRKEDGYIEIDLSEIPYIEAGLVQNYRFILVSGDQNYNPENNYYNTEGTLYSEDELKEIGFNDMKLSGFYTLFRYNEENEQRIYISETDTYDPNIEYFNETYNEILPIQDDSFILSGFGKLQEDKAIYLKETGGTYQRANDNQDFIYIMLLDENGEVCSEPYIASEVELNSDKIYIYAQETGPIFTGNPQESDVNITRKNDISKFTSGCSVLVDYYVKKEKNALQINITPDKFGGNFYLEASTLFRDKNGTDLPAEFIIPNCKIQSNFTFTMASSGDPSTFTFTMDAFPDYTRWNKKEKVFATVQVIEQNDILENLERLGTEHNYKSDEDYNPFLTFVREQEKYLLNSNDQPEVFNNAIFSSIDENGLIYEGLGYKKNMSLSGSGDLVGLEGYITTGFIPFNKDWSIYIQGFKEGDDKNSSQRFILYNKNKEKESQLIFGAQNVTTPPYVIKNLELNEQISSSQTLKDQLNQAAYIRISFHNTKLSEISVIIDETGSEENIPTRKRGESAWEITYPEIKEEEPEIEPDER